MKGKRKWVMEMKKKVRLKMRGKGMYVIKRKIRM